MKCLAKLAQKNMNFILIIPTLSIMLSGISHFLLLYRVYKMQVAYRINPKASLKAACDILSF
jgi:capsular polysaccharide biosynthesis protein